MRKKTDFSKATRGPVLDTTGKEYVTVRLDSEVYEYFGSQAERQGRGYQGLIDAALRTAMDTGGSRLDGSAQGHAGKHGKERFPLWLDSDVLSQYRILAVNQGADYQELINEALRNAMQSNCNLKNEKEPHEAAPGDGNYAGQLDPAQAIRQS
jgi:uncharacterized protein (DUF4415 family)